MVKRAICALVATGLAAGCSSSPRATQPGFGPLTTEQEDVLQRCREAALAFDGRNPERGGSAATGATVAGQIVRSAAFDPLAFLFSLPVAAVAGAASAVIDAKLTQGGREAMVKGRTEACFAEAQRRAVASRPPTTSSRDGTAELRSLGVEAPR